MRANHHPSSPNHCISTQYNLQTPKSYNRINHHSKSSRSNRRRLLVAAPFRTRNPGTGTELGCGDETNADPAYTPLLFASETLICFFTVNGPGPNRSVEPNNKSRPTSFFTKTFSAETASLWFLFWRLNFSPRFRILTCPVTRFGGDRRRSRSVTGLRFRRQFWFAEEAKLLWLLLLELGFLRDATRDVAIAKASLWRNRPWRQSWERRIAVPISRERKLEIVF